MAETWEQVITYWLHKYGPDGAERRQSTSSRPSCAYAGSVESSMRLPQGS
jgi:hypothetical protein